MQKCISKTGKPIPAGIFEVFGHFNNMNACDVQHEMVGWALDNKDELSETVRIALSQLNISINYWINNIQ